MFKNKTILITGGTGSFGKYFTNYILKKYQPKKIIIYSRDEMKQWNMAIDLNNNKKVKFIIGDVRDKQSLINATSGVDYIVHAAATKIVPTSETNPFECIKTNINGAMNVIEAANYNKIIKVISLSTDKACNPVNLYGATKLASDKLFIAANSIDESTSTIFAIVRYGNVMGSRGSVIPYFLNLLTEKKDITITDQNMTRFMITLEQAVELVLQAFNDSYGGEIYVKKIPSMNIMEIAKSISKSAKLKIIGIRPGEKIHEQMITQEDAIHTYEYKDYYKIFPSINAKKLDKRVIKNGKKVKDTFLYRSDLNNKWMKSKELSNWIIKNKKNFNNY